MSTKKTRQLGKALDRQNHLNMMKNQLFMNVNAPNMHKKRPKKSQKGSEPKYHQYMQNAGELGGVGGKARLLKGYN